MDKITMQNALAALNISEDAWLFDSDLNYIILTNDGNHYHDYHSETINFDMTNELLLIKVYKATLLSSKFFNLTKTGANTYWAHPNKYGYIGLSYKNFDRFREPAVGDRLKTFSSALVDDVEITEIASHPNGGLIITTDTDITIVGLLTIYSHPVTDSSLLPPSDGTFLVNDNNDLTAILGYAPVTNYTVDEYIGFDSIEGFSLKRG